MADFVSREERARLGASDREPLFVVATGTYVDPGSGREHWVLSVSDNANGSLGTILRPSRPEWARDNA